MNSEANCEIALRYFFAIKQIGLQVQIETSPIQCKMAKHGKYPINQVFKGPQYAYMFCLEFSCKGFLYN
ncbi:MAG: hypothetical protein C4548_14855 [Desulfobacteraceae bacterium]|nr:MAG: hypothetical protein C4548_14855 [Desulfobacteraceae bacterium]